MRNRFTDATLVSEGIAKTTVADCETRVELCRRTGDKGYETGFCFCVLGCPLKGYFARLNTNSRVTPAGVRGFVNFNSSSVIDVTIRR